MLHSGYEFHFPETRYFDMLNKLLIKQIADFILAKIERQRESSNSDNCTQLPERLSESC